MAFTGPGRFWPPAYPWGSRVPTHEWCAPFLGHEATAMRGDRLYTLPEAGPNLQVSFLGLQVGLQLPTGRILAITRLPRPYFGSVGPALPPRAVYSHDFVYGTLGSASAQLSLEDMQAFLGLLPNGLQEASMLWSGQGAGCAQLSPEVAAYLQAQSWELRRINMAARRASG